MLKSWPGVGCLFDTYVSLCSASAQGVLHYVVNKFRVLAHILRALGLGFSGIFSLSQALVKVHSEYVVVFVPTLVLTLSPTSFVGLP
jgi:VanZ family protein